MFKPCHFFSDIIFFQKIHVRFFSSSSNNFNQNMSYSVECVFSSLNGERLRGNGLLLDGKYTKSTLKPFLKFTHAKAKKKKTVR